MSKELFVSSTPQETKLALTEDDQLAEVYFERANEYTLAGSIYKGRVTRVLPGMQSAFVDIGLDRDAFLYVSDFLELPDEDELEDIVVSSRQPAGEPGEHDLPPARGQAHPEVAPQESRQPEQEYRQTAQTPGEPEGRQNSAAPEQDQEEGPRRWRGRRRRRAGRRGPAFPDNKYTPQAQSQSQSQTQGQPPREHLPESRPRRDFGPPPGYQPIILPGESISKYQHLAKAAAPPQHIPQPQPAAPAGQNQGEAIQGTGIAPAREVEPQRERDDFAAASEAAQHAELNKDAREQRQRLEQMNVAAIFGGAAADTEEETADELAEAREQTPSLPSFSTPEPPRAHASSGQVVEEEEIEEEEADLSPFGTDLDEIDYEDLEEETLARDDAPSGQPQMISAGEQLTEAVEETAQEEAAIFDGAPENGESLHTEEAETEEPPEELSGESHVDNEDASGRAELRASAATAPYQQRAERPERAQFDRRGGRRPRAGMRPRREFQRPQLITDLLKQGQEVLVQIAKEPIGKKGARITSHIALPGRFLVYMPTVVHIGVSRKISSEEERQRLKRIVMSERENGHGGFIVRTAAAGVSEGELRADIQFLKNLWSEIKERAESDKSPALIYHDLNLVERILRDQLNQEFSRIMVDTEQEYERILRFVSRFQPALVKRVKLYTKDTPLFEEFNIQDEINKALKSKVWLKSGGYIVINQTEALVAIDVNTGKYVGKTARLEDTIVKTNVDAIKEIVRQIRLRDLGGIIVIDFIDMDERRNRQKVMQALEEALKSDRSPSKVLQFNDFGLVAITRKRVKHSLERTLGMPCPYCTGTGLVKSVTTVCNEIYTEMRKTARHLERGGGDITLRVNPEVAKALKGNNARWLQDMEELTGRTVLVKSDPTLHQEQFDIQ